MPCLEHVRRLDWDHPRRTEEDQGDLSVTIVFISRGNGFTREVLLGSALSGRFLAPLGCHCHCGLLGSGMGREAWLRIGLKDMLYTVSESHPSFWVPPSSLEHIAFLSYPKYIAFSSLLPHCAACMGTPSSEREASPRSSVKELIGTGIGLARLMTNRTSAMRPAGVPERPFFALSERPSSTSTLV